LCVLAATGRSLQHFLALVNGLRPLVMSLAATAVPTAVYATGADFGEDGAPLEVVRGRLARALSEADVVAAAISAR